MAVWPFRRKSRRKRPRSPGPQTEPDPTTRDAPDEPARTRRKLSKRKEPQKTQKPAPTAMMTTKRQPNKLQRRERSYSFERGTEDALAIQRRRTSRKWGTGAAPTPAQAQAHEQVQTQAQGSSADPHTHPHSKDFGLPDVSALFQNASPDNQNNIPRMPTLHNKRNAEPLPRKKSSKRRRADDAREAEIRAMTGFEPHRPAAEPWQAGRPLKKDSRKVKSGLGLGFRRSWEREHPHSDISLPMPGSIHSSLSSDSDQVAFRVSALEALAPRPTLRYAVHPRYSAPPAPRPSRHISVKNKVAEKQPIPEATLKAHKRIDDLADDLTASDIRELMERDERRRARKRERDQERLERRLARRAEKEKAAEQEGRKSPMNLDRGALGRESVGLGIEPDSAVVTSSTPRAASKRSTPSPTAKQLGKRPAAAMEEEDDDDVAAPQGPLEHFHRTDSIPLDNVSIASEHNEPATSRTSSPRKKIILMPRTSRSKSPPPPVNPPKDSSARKSSEGSIKRLRRSWSNLFRWGSKRRSGPSSFSNTSRDSMTGTPPVAPAAPIPAALQRKLSSNVPKRTLSRFREDLPELPLSPPQSREASPEPVPSAIMEQDTPELDTHMDLGDSIPKRRDTPMSPVDDTTGSVPASIPTSTDPTPEPVPISLGTVDSEGAWFGKRVSNHRPIPRPMTPPAFHHDRPVSVSTFDSHHDPDLPTQNVVEGDSYLPDDEDMSGFAPGSSDSPTEVRPASNDSDDGARWGIVGGHRPHVVEPHAGIYVKSREGLLNTFSDDGRSDMGEGDDEDKENSLVGAHIATRHSRGSVKLLDIPRSSLEARKA